MIAVDACIQSDLKWRFQVNWSPRNPSHSLALLDPLELNWYVGVQLPRRRHLIWPGMQASAALMLAVLCSIYCKIHFPGQMFGRIFWATFFLTTLSIDQGWSWKAIQWNDSSTNIQFPLTNYECWSHRQITCMQIQPEPFNSFHPHSDNQVEHINVLLKEFVRHVFNIKQDNWLT